MVMTAATTSSAQFAGFAAQARVPLVPLAVNGTEVEYGFDDTAERTQPEPFLKLRSVPLYVSEMLVASGEGEGEALQQTGLYSEWRRMQEATNRFSDEIETLNQEALRFGPGMRRPAYWKEFRSRADSFSSSSDLSGLVDAAIVGLLLNENNCGNVGSIPFECVRSFNRAVYELLKASRYDTAAMLLESATAADLSFISGIEFLGRRTAKALGRSMVARKKDASYDHLLARGIWYGWFEDSGVFLESFHLASAEQNFDVERYSDCAAHYVRMIAARLRRPKLSKDDWKWIEDMLDVTITIWKQFGGSSEKIEAARELKSDAEANAGVA